MVSLPPTNPYMSPPQWPSPSPAPTGDASNAVQELRGWLISGGFASNPQVLGALSLQQFGVDFSQLTSTEKASIAQMAQSYQQQAANLPDDQFARFVAGNSGVFSIVDSLDPRGFYNTIRNYVAATPSAPLPTMDQKRLEADMWQRQQEMSGYMDQNQTQRTLQREESEFQRNNALAQLAANPRNIGQWLGMVGLDPATTLQGSPVVANALQRAGLPPGLGQIGIGGEGTFGVEQGMPSNGLENVSTGGGRDMLQPNGLPPTTMSTLSSGPPPNPNPYGNTPAFSFIRGRQAGYMSPEGTRGMIQDFNNNTSRAQMTGGLASLSGQNENDFWSDFSQSLPGGSKVGATRFGGGF